MRVLIAISVLVLLPPSSAFSGERGLQLGAGYSSLFTAQEYIDKQSGFHIWAAQTVQENLEVRVGFSRAGLGDRYIGFVPFGGIVPPEFEPVIEGIDQRGSLSLLDLTLSGSKAFTPGVTGDLGAGFGLTWVRMNWEGDSTGFTAAASATRPHVVAMAGISGQPFARWPVALQVRYTFRRVAGSTDRALDAFEPFADAFNVSGLTASLLWRL
jgi:hypothetical protein